MAEDTVVLIYVWLSSLKKPREHSKSANEGIFVGHASLEILEYDNNASEKREPVRGSWDENTYVSIGPGDAISISGAYDSMKMKATHTFTDDIKYGYPDYTFCFHDLDTRAIKEAIQTYKSNETELYYKLFCNLQTTEDPFFIRFYRKYFGNPLPVYDEKKSQSHCCVSIVFAVLQKGMFFKWLSTSEMRLVNKNQSLETSTDSLINSAEAITKRSLESLQKIFNTFGYFVEVAGSSVAISPDIFAEFMKEAKRNQLKAGIGKTNGIAEHINGIEEWRPSEEPNSIIRFWIFVLAVIIVFLLKKIFPNQFYF